MDAFWDMGFLRHAVLAGLFAGVACALAGVFAVLMRLTFIGVCLAHAAFAGGLLSLLFGWDPLAGALAASIVAAGAIGPMADRGEISPDTAVGVVFSAMLGLAIFCLGLLPGPKTAGLNLFWGNILTVSRRDLWLLGGVAVTASLAILLFFKEIQAVACHRRVARACGLPTTAIYYGILLFTGLTVTACMPSIGGLLIYSLLITPAAAAYQLTYRLGRLFLLSALFGIVSCEGGLFLAWKLDVPAGASIVLVSFLIFLVCLALSPKRKAGRAQEA